MRSCWGSLEWPSALHPLIWVFLYCRERNNRRRFSNRLRILFFAVQLSVRIVVSSAQTSGFDSLFAFIIIIIIIISDAISIANHVQTGGPGKWARGSQDNEPLVRYFSLPLPSSSSFSSSTFFFPFLCISMGQSQLVRWENRILIIAYHQVPLRLFRL